MSSSAQLEPHDSHRPRERCSLLLNLTEFIAKSRRLCVNCIAKERAGEKQTEEKERERSSDNTAGLSLFIQKWSNKKVEPSGCHWHDSTRTGRTKRCCKLMENKSSNEQKPLMNHLCFAGWSLYVYRDIPGDGYGWLAFIFWLCAAREPIVRWRLVHARAGRSAAVLFRN